MEVEQRFDGHGLEFGSILCQSFAPSFIGGEACSAVPVGSVVVSNFGSEQFIGLLMVGDFLVGKERNEAFLEGAKESFDFAFGLGGRSDAVIDMQGAKSALEVAAGIQPIDRGGMTK